MRIKTKNKKVFLTKLLAPLAFLILSLCLGCQSIGYSLGYKSGHYIKTGEWPEKVDWSGYQPLYNFQLIESQQPISEAGLKLNAYGLGIHSNKYGQPVILRPDGGGVYGEILQIKEDAYGLGVHSDQYGRPVREYPWP